MTKWIICTCFFLISNIIYAQKLSSDTLSLQKASQGILSRKISFSSHEGKLEDVLSKLSIEQNIKFSYSHDRIQHVSIKEKIYSSTELSALLTDLLRHSNFNYLLVGRIIVIVEDDKNSNAINQADTYRLPVDSVATPSQTSAAFPDSALTHSDSTSGIPPLSGTSPQLGTSITEKNISNLGKTTIRSNVPDHIYSPDLNLAKLPPSERRKIQKMYKKELEWAYYFNHSRSETNDTLDKIKVKVMTVVGYQESRYYISGSLGLIHYTPRIKGTKEFSWNEDLDYHSNVKTSIRPEISFGFMTRNLMIGAGVGYQQLKVKEHGMSIYKRSNGIGQGQGNQPDTFNYSFSDKYSIVSVPLEIFLFKQKKKLFAGIGSKLEVDFIHAEVEKDKFKEYYEKKVKDGIYSDKNNKMALAGSLKVQAGIFVQNDLALAAGVMYNYYITPFTKNSIYTFYPNFLQFEVSLFYFLSKSNVRRILGGH